MIYIYIYYKSITFLFPFLDPSLDIFRLVMGLVATIYQLWLVSVPDFGHLYRHTNLELVHSSDEKIVSGSNLDGYLTAVLNVLL